MIVGSLDKCPSFHIVRSQQLSAPLPLVPVRAVVVAAVVVRSRPVPLYRSDSTRV